MLIQVKYRDVFKKYFTTGPYTYNCDFDVKVGDLVIVPTRFGTSLGQVSALNVRLINEKDKAKIVDVLEVCKTKYPLPEVQNGT